MAKITDEEEFVAVPKKQPVQKKVEAAKPAKEAETPARVFREPQPVPLTAEKKVAAHKPPKTPSKVEPLPDLRRKLARAERMERIEKIEARVEIPVKGKRKFIEEKPYRPGAKFSGIKPTPLKPTPLGKKIVSPLPKPSLLPVTRVKASVLKVTKKEPAKPSYLWLFLILGLVGYVVVKR